MPGRGRDDQLTVRAMDLARRSEVAAVEARHRRQGQLGAIARALGEMPLHEMIEQIERAPALAGPGANANRERCRPREAKLGREWDRRKVVADRPAAILGELDQRG